MDYEFFEDLAIADVQFRARGETRETVFRAAAEATMNVMVEDLDTIEPRREERLELENDALDMLLFDLLQELIFYKDAERLLLRVRHVDIRDAGGGYRLVADAAGEPLDENRHAQGVDVKAVTLHRFALERDDRGWHADVILDV